jgi:DNA-binding NarL/FixJ family response regulator
VVDVWLVEDDAELRTSLARALRQSADGIHLTQVFGTAAGALDAAAQGLSADVVLVDLGLPDLAGEELIARLIKLRPTLALIALTVRCDDAAIFGALRAGAVGYLLKDSSLEAIQSALSCAVSGGSPMSPSIARRVVRQLQPDQPPGAGFNLTPREREVLELLCSGASYREVANCLGIGEGTAHTHVKRVYEKLGAASKAEAVRIALDARLVPLRGGG